MLAQSISIVGRSFWRSLSEFAGKLQIVHRRLQEILGETVRKNAA